MEITEKVRLDREGEGWAVFNEDVRVDSFGNRADALKCALRIKGENKMHEAIFNEFMPIFKEFAVRVSKETGIDLEIVEQSIYEVLGDGEDNYPEGCHPGSPERGTVKVPSQKEENPPAPSPVRARKRMEALEQIDKELRRLRDDLTRILNTDKRESLRDAGYYLSGASTNILNLDIHRALDTVRLALAYLNVAFALGPEKDPVKPLRKDVQKLLEMLQEAEKI